MLTFGIDIYKLHNEQLSRYSVIPVSRYLSTPASLIMISNCLAEQKVDVLVAGTI